MYVQESADGENDYFSYGVSSMQGWRTDQEDAHSAVLEVAGGNRTAIFAIFDGHGGREVSKFCAAHLVSRGSPVFAERRIQQASLLILPPAQPAPSLNPASATALGLLLQPQELAQAEGFNSGDVERAMAETFLHMDELLVKDEFREELKALKGSDSDEEKE